MSCGLSLPISISPFILPINTPSKSVWVCYSFILNESYFLERSLSNTSKWVDLTIAFYFTFMTAGFAICFSISLQWFSVTRILLASSWSSHSRCWHWGQTFLSVCSLVALDPALSSKQLQFDDSDSIPCKDSYDPRIMFGELPRSLLSPKSKYFLQVIRCSFSKLPSSWPT